MEIRLHGVTTQAQADAIAREAERKLRSGALECPATWPEAVEGFIKHRRAEGDREGSLATYRTRLNAIGRVLDDPDPRRFGREHGLRYRELRAQMPGARRGTTVSGRTIAAELDAGTELQRWLVTRGWRADAPWESVPRPDTEHGRSILHPHEIGPWLRAAERLSKKPPGEARSEDWSRWHAAAWLQVLGLRRGELRQLLGRDLDLVGLRLPDGRDVVLVYVRDRATARTKSRDSIRCLPVTTPSAVTVLRDTFAGLTPDAPAFPGRRGKMLTKCTKWFIRRTQLTCAAAGLAPVTGHELRHSFATAMRRLGVGYDDLAPWLGHSDPRVTRTAYVHADPMHLLGPAVQMGELLEGLAAGRPGLFAVRR